MALPWPDPRTTDRRHPELGHPDLGGSGLRRPDLRTIELLPDYFEPEAAAPPRALHRFVEDISRTSRPEPSHPDAPPAAWLLPNEAGQLRSSSGPVFSQMDKLNRDVLAAGIDRWWVRRSSNGTLLVRRRLQLGPPEGSATTGWIMRGKMRRCTGLHWVPVVIEFWPKYQDFTLITMTPTSRVRTSRRYFRLGLCVLDSLRAELAKISVN
jgi:hypothetical protein